jgi:DNA-binding LacI/PurR family transcriptional regulator
MTIKLYDHPERATLQTIADRLGVSRTTVSNAYSRPDQLNPALREKILTVAREIGYSGPHPAARSLRRGRSDSLGVVFTESLSYAVTDPAALLFLQGIAEASEPSGTGLLLLPAPHGRRASASAVLDAVVDGFLVYCVAEDDERLQAVLDRRLPTVMVDQGQPPGTAFVGIDDQGGARAAAEHLLALGHRRFGVIAFPLAEDDYHGPADLDRQAAATFPTSAARLAGFSEALRGAGLRWEDVPVQETALNSIAAGAQAAAPLLDRADRPTAILAFSDLLALGALRAAADRGLRVPENLSITGFDDSPGAAESRPPLTTVRQPLLHKGLVAARMLLEGWVGEPPGVILPTELVVRATTGPASG